MSIDTNLFQKILIAIDTSNMAEAVFERGLCQGQLNQARLMLLHVLSAEEDNCPLPIFPEVSDIYPVVGNDRTLQVWREQWEAFVEETREKLANKVEIAEAKGVTTEYRQIVGSAGRTICTVAREWQADLILIGRRGRSGLGEIILGSVSNYVLHHAPCSVLIVQ
jgi:nucleotide-binding universal stress UspA family protein